MTNLIGCEIVSAEEQLYTGDIEMLIATGIMGELGIAANHAPLLTQLVPGPLRIILSGGEEQVFYASGGMLEVQPKKITVLTDTAQRAHDVDEEAALKAKEEASRLLQDKNSDIDYTMVNSQLLEAAAQLRTLQKIRKQLNR